MPFLSSDAAMYSVLFPNLESVSRLKVESDLRLDCDSIIANFSEATNIPKYAMSCESAKSNSGSSLVAGARTAIGVVVGIVGLLMMG
jgi:hypothetical protein